MAGRTARLAAEKCGVDEETAEAVLQSFWCAVKEAVKRAHVDGLDPRRPCAGVRVWGLGTFLVKPGRRPTKPERVEARKRRASRLKGEK